MVPGPRDEYTCGLLPASFVGIPAGARMDCYNDSASAVTLTAQTQDGNTVALKLQQQTSHGSMCFLDSRVWAGVTAGAGGVVLFAIVPRDAVTSWL
jgi:hypothetical protein